MSYTSNELNTSIFNPPCLSSQAVHDFKAKRQWMLLPTPATGELPPSIRIASSSSSHALSNPTHYRTRLTYIPSIDILILHLYPPFASTVICYHHLSTKPNLCLTCDVSVPLYFTLM